MFGNAHFGGRLIGDVMQVKLVVPRWATCGLCRRREMGFGYDRSRLRETGEILLSACFRSPGRSRHAGLARASLAFRKRTQPLETPSAGCIFQNPQPGLDAVPDGIPWSAGALVDRAGMKGQQDGGARVSPTHGNFIVNDGRATAETSTS